MDAIVKLRNEAKLAGVAGSPPVLMMRNRVDHLGFQISADAFRREVIPALKKGDKWRGRGATWHRCLYP